MRIGIELDDYIVAYCAEKNYRVDGDVFGVLFSDAETVNYTCKDVARIIEKAAVLFDLAPVAKPVELT
ncbi:MAG: hypothetical protein V4527_18895 [Pseudomonadota bacterium]